MRAKGELPLEEELEGHGDEEVLPEGDGHDILLGAMDDTSVSQLGRDRSQECFY